MKNPGPQFQSLTELISIGAPEYAFLTIFNDGEAGDSQITFRNPACMLESVMPRCS